MEGHFGSSGPSLDPSRWQSILDHHIAMLQQHGQYLEQLAREAEPRIFDQLTEHKTLVNMRVRARHMLDDAQDARRIMENWLTTQNTAQSDPPPAQQGQRAQVPSPRVSPNPCFFADPHPSPIRNSGEAFSYTAHTPEAAHPLHTAKPTQPPTAPSSTKPPSGPASKKGKKRQRDGDHDPNPQSSINLGRPSKRLRRLMKQQGMPDPTAERNGASANGPQLSHHAPNSNPNLTPLPNLASAPKVEFDDISAEVDARLRAKAQERKVKGKRKRESGDSGLGVGEGEAGGPAWNGVQNAAGRRQRKRPKQAQIDGGPGDGRGGGAGTRAGKKRAQDGVALAERGAKRRVSG